LIKIQISRQQNPELAFVFLVRHALALANLLAKIVCSFQQWAVEVIEEWLLLQSVL